MEQNTLIEKFAATKLKVETLIERKQSAKPSEMQSLNYFIFEDTLQAAGFAKALNEDPNVIKYFLQQASQAALEVYKFKSTTIGKIGYLPSLEEDYFIDESMTNSWTHIRAIYASAASKSWKELKKIIEISRDSNISKQVETLDIVEQFLDILILLVKKTLSVNQVTEFLTYYSVSKNDNEIYWYRQAEVIMQIIGKNKVNFDTSLENLAEFIINYYTERRLQNHHDYLLLLPVLGLKSLSKFYTN